MVHKKYTIKNGKHYGPYFYSTQRKGDKVVTNYLGKDVVVMKRPEWRFMLGIVGGIIIFLALLLFLSYNSKLTGRASLDIDSTYSPGEIVGGQLKLSLTPGELIPADALVTATLGGASRAFTLSQILDNETYSGAFYLTDHSLQGDGLGYGVPGSARVYPNLTFTLRIGEFSEEVDSIPEPVSEPASNDTEGSEDSESVPELNDSSSSESEGSETPSDEPSDESPEDSSPEGSEEQAPSDQPDSGSEDSETPGDSDEGSETPSDEPSDESSSEESSDEGSDSGDSGITGEAISEDSFSVEGVVSRDLDFSYRLQTGQSAEIVPGSVMVNGEPVPDGSIDIDLSSNLVTVSTSYSIEVEGFGPDFVGGDSVVFAVNLEGFGLVALDDTNLSVVIEHEGQELVSARRDIATSDLPELNVSALNITDIIVNESTNTSVTITQLGARLGEPVKWTKHVVLGDPASLVVELPEGADNVQLVDLEAGEDPEGETVRIDSEGNVNTEEGSPEVQSSGTSGAAVSEFSSDREVVITGNVVNEGDALVQTDEVTGAVELSVQQPVSEAIVEYETPAAYSLETSLDRGKEVLIVGPESVHYESLVAFSQLDSSWNVRNPGVVSVYWKEGQQTLDSSLSDTDSDGVYDYVEWIVPHLSNQTFIIEISNALHLNQSRGFISNIYDQVITLDGNWSEPISDGEYVRVTFERNLTSINDITVFSRVVNGSPLLNVYEIDGSDLLAQFSPLYDGNYSKIYLTNLTHEQDTFDLHVLNGVLEFDHIIDPFIDNGSATQTVHDCGNLTSNSSVFTLNQSFVAYSINSLSGSCLHISAYNSVLNCNGHSVTNTTGSITAISAWGINTTIKNCNINLSNSAGGAVGITIAAANATLINNTIIGGEIGIYLTSGGDGSGGNYVANNTVRDSYDTASTVGSGINIEGTDSNTLTGNTISNALYGVYLTSARMNVVRDTSISSTNFTYGGVPASDGSAIYLSIASNNTFTNATLNNVNWGVRLFSGVNQNNTFNNFVINATKNVSIQMGAVSSRNNTFENFTITNTDGRGREFVVVNSLNNTRFINVPLANYSFTGSAGSTILFRNSSVGEVLFTRPVNGSGIGLYGTYNGVLVINRSVFINETTGAGGLNKTANITFFNQPGNYNSPAIYRYGAACPADVCYNFTSLNAATVVFNVSGGGNYTLLDTNPPAQGDTTQPAISFVAPTPSNASTWTSSALYVNVSSSDANRHYTLLDINRDLVFWMRFDDVNGTGQPTDISTYSNNASYLSGAANNSTSHYGLGAQFDGVNDVVKTTVSSPSGLTNGSNFTLAAWVNINTLGSFGSIVGSTEASSFSNIAYSIETRTNPQIRCAIGNGTAASDTGAYTPTAGVWTHLACVWNGTTLVLYVNGASSQSTAISLAGQVPAIRSENILAIGAGYAGGAAFVNGTIDEVAIFSRALSATEVGALFNATATQLSRNFTLGSRNYNFTAHAVDNSANRNQTHRTITVNTDTTAPAISIVYPTATAYAATPTELNYTVSDANLQSCWYSFDGGGENTSITCGQNASGFNSKGQTTWTVYANDSFGNTNSSNVTFSLDESVPLINVFSPSNTSYSTYSIGVAFNGSDANGISARWFSNDTGNTTYAPSNISAQPAGPTVLRVQSCAASDSQAVNTYSGSCDGTYPSATDFLGASDGVYEAQTFTLDGGGSKYGGISINVSNSSVTACERVTNVSLCFNWWVDNPEDAISPVIEVDASGGGSFSTASSDAPGQGFTCVDVTSLESWSCSNFFGSTGVRALARNKITTLSFAVSNVYTDALFFNVSYISGMTVNVSEGSHTFRFYANDSVGNTNLSAVTFFVDSLAPTASFVTPTETNASYLTRSNIVLNVSASDTNLANVTFVLYNTTGLVNRSANTSAQFFFNFSSLADGTYYFNATATDQVNTRNTTERRTVTIDTAGPTISFVTPTDSSGSTLTRNFTLVNASASDANLANITVRIYNSSTLISANNSTSSVLYLNYSNLANGVYFFNATATDLANTISNTSTYNVTIETPQLITCQNLTVSNSVYILRSNISTSTTCFNVLANNITLDLNGYNVSGDSNNEADYGVSINGYNNSIVKNGTIRGFGRAVSVQGYNSSVRDLIINASGDFGSSSGSSAYGVYLSGDNGTRVQNVLVLGMRNQDATGHAYGVFLNNSQYSSVVNVSVNHVFGGGGVFASSSGGVAEAFSLNSVNYSTVANVSSYYVLGGDTYITGGTPGLSVGLYATDTKHSTFTNLSTIKTWPSTDQGTDGTGQAYGVYFGSGSANNTVSAIFVQDYNVGALAFVSSQNISARNITIDARSGTYGNVTGLYISASRSINVSAFSVNSSNAAIALYSPSVGISLTNATFTNRGTYDLSSAADVNDTQLVNVSIEGYSVGQVYQFLTRSVGLGEVRFLEGVNGSGTNFSADVRFASNFVFINDSAASGGFNKSANVTLYNMPGTFSLPRIFRNGVLCTSCYNFTSLNAATVVFNISFGGNYSVGENDVTNPRVSMVYPTNTSYSVNVSQINYTVSDANLQACWYSTNLGVTNTTITCGVNVTGLTASQGSNTWRVYANDSFGNSNTSSVTFFVDSLSPTIDYVTPTEANGSYVSRANVLVNVTASDTNLANISVRLYADDHTLLDSTSSGTSPYFVNISSYSDEFGLQLLSDGTYYFNATSTDSLNTRNHTQTRRVTIDTTIPALTILSPANTSYTSVLTALNYTATDTNLQACWYSTNLGVTNTTITCGVNVTGLTASQGSNTWRMYANDSAGNLNISTTTFFVDSFAPQISFSNGTEPNREFAAGGSIYINVSLNETNIANITFIVSNGSGVVNSTVYTSSVSVLNVTSLGDGSYNYSVNVTDVVNTRNTTGVRSLTLLSSCLGSICTEGGNCTISTSCMLHSGLCTGSICDFTNFNITNTGKVYTLYNDSNDANNLVLNVSANVTWRSGGQIIFSGKNATLRGGNAGIVNITVPNLFYRRNATFIGMGGYSTASSTSGGNGGYAQVNYHGLVNTQYNTTGSNVTGGTSTSATSGSSGSIIFVKDSVCPLDADLNNDGQITLLSDITPFRNTYNNITSDPTFNATYDLNCDGIINIIDLSKAGSVFGRA